MIQVGTFLNILDNSGGRKAQCLRIIKKGFKNRYGYIGDMILVSIKSLRRSKNIKIKKGSMHKALIIRTKKKIAKGINFFSFSDNSVILLNVKTNKPIGTRILSPLPKLFKYTKFLKFISISSGLI